MHHSSQRLIIVLPAVAVLGVAAAAMAYPQLPNCAAKCSHSVLEYDSVGGTYHENTPYMATPMCCDPGNPNCMGGTITGPTGEAEIYDWTHGMKICNDTNCNNPSTFTEAAVWGNKEYITTLVRDDCTGDVPPPTELGGGPSSP